MARFSSAKFVLLFSAAVVTSAAQATTGVSPPGPVTSVADAHVYNNGTEVAGDISIQAQVDTGASAVWNDSSASATTVSNSGGQPKVSYGGTATPGMKIIADASLQYEFELVGTGAYTGPVNLSVTGSYQYTGDPAYVSGGTGIMVCPTDCYAVAPISLLNINTPDASVKNYTVNLTITPNTIYQIFMGGNLTINDINGTGNVSAEAWIDPLLSFSVADTSVDTSNFQLIYSDGVYPPATEGGVPEPATWAMLVAGFGLLGGAMRSRLTGRNVRLVGDAV